MITKLGKYVLASDFDNGYTPAIAGGVGGAALGAGAGVIGASLVNGPVLKKLDEERKACQAKRLADVRGFRDGHIESVQFAKAVAEEDYNNRAAAIDKKYSDIIKNYESGAQAGTITPEECLRATTEQRRSWTSELNKARAEVDSELASDLGKIKAEYADAMKDTKARAFGDFEQRNAKALELAKRNKWVGAGIGGLAGLAGGAYLVNKLVGG